MNKKDLINEIAARSTHYHAAGLTKAQIDAALSALGDIAKAQLTRPDAELTLPGIGKLVVVAKPARTGRNPATGEAIEIAAHNGLKFRVAKEMKDAMA